MTDASHVIDAAPPAAESPFRGFFESLAVGAVQLSAAGRFLEVNERFCTLTGYGRDELLRMRVADLDHPDDRPLDRERWRAFLADPAVGYDVEKRYVRRDGRVIWVHVTGAMIHADRARPLIAKTVEDITARVEAKRILQESEDRLREALAVREEFLGLVSHELRTPLTVIVGMANVMARKRTSVRLMRETALEIRESAEHLASLLESMLVLARADREDAVKEPLMLTHVLERVVGRHREVHPDRRIVLDVRTRDALIEGNEAWVEQVVANLIGNAEKYSPSDAEVTVVLDREDPRVIVRVLDEGPGVDPADQPLIFEPFYRAAHAREHSGGLGLGLAVCRRLVELQGGTVWSRPRPGGGTEFGFALPGPDVSHEDPLVPAAAGARPAASADVPAAPGTGPDAARVLAPEAPSIAP